MSSRIDDKSVAEAVDAENVQALCERLGAIRNVLVQRTQCEHDELLERLDELIARCQTAAAPTAAQEQALEQEVRQLVRQLRLHEAQEDRIMQRGPGVCVDADPVEQGSARPAEPTGGTC